MTDSGSQHALHSPHSDLHPSFQHDRFLVRRKVFVLLGAAVHTYDDTGEVVLFTKMKGLKLKEDISIFSDEKRSKELLRIRARRVLDISSEYDVFDTSGGGEVLVGTLQRHGMKSMLRDEWGIYDANGDPIGMIQEEGAFLAIIRRFIDIVSAFLPQKYVFTIHGQEVGSMQQTYNPFIFKMTADFSSDPQAVFDRRLAAAASILLSVIEGKQ